MEVINIMTEEQMYDRMKEIDEERNRLKVERQKYENYFFDKKREEELNNHKNYIGKCYVSNDLKENENKHIKAFKVINILENPNERYALCIVLIDGYRYTCWNEYGIQIMTLGLWSSNKLSLMSKESDPKMIDFYHETTQEIFEELYREYFEAIKEKVYG